MILSLRVIAAWLESVPDFGLWRPLGNNIIEKTSTPWPNKFNDCKDICGMDAGVSAHSPMCQIELLHVVRTR